MLVEKMGEKVVDQESKIKSDKEIWKPIKGYENLYEVSNHGNVKSFIRHGNNRVRILNGSLADHDSERYLLVSLHKNNIKENKRIHIIVAETFLGKPNFKVHIHHKDENRLNNHVDNLEWVTVRQHSRKHILGVKNPNHKLCDKDVKTMRFLKALYPEIKNKYFSAIFGVKVGQISKVLLFKEWKEV